MAVDDNAIMLMAAGAGLGAIALHYLNDPERREAFLTWMDAKGEAFPRDFPPEVTLECAEAACTGLHRMMTEATS